MSLSRSAHLTGRRQCRLGRRALLDPAHRLLFLQRPRAPWRHLLRIPGPDPTCRQPQRRPVRRIQRQHRMHKQIRNPTVAAWPKTAPGATQKAQVRGILDRQNMPPPWPACPRPSPRRPLPTSPPGSTETFQIPPCKPDRAQACAQSNFVPRQDGLPEEPPFCPPFVAKAVPEHLPEMQAHETLQRASNEPSESSSQTPRNHPLIPVSL